MKLKLVKKNKIPRIPRVNSSVEKTLQNALYTAKCDKSDAVIIITTDKNGIRINTSRVNMYNAIGILARAQNVLMGGE